MTARAALVGLAVAAAGCGGDARPCDTSGPQPSRADIVCAEEFQDQAARPLDASLPGAWTIKTIIDRAQDETVHFLDTNAYPVHVAFAREHLGWPPGQDFFTEYLYPQRRFMLGSVTWYEQPDLYVYELAPYDTADVDMITRSMDLLDGALFADLAFHPTSEEQRTRAEELPERIRVVTTEEIYDGIDYQPLNLGETVAQVRVLDAADLATEYVSPREIAVLDQVPNDIAVVAAVVTAEFQTPLSHVNVLSQQRGTPNMALRGAQELLEPYQGSWVRLTVSAFDWSVTEVTQAEADAWFDEHRPTPVVITEPDYTRMDLPDVDDLSLTDIPAIGGKVAHFAELRNIGDPVVVRDGFAIPVHYYDQFLTQNGFDVRIDAMLIDEQFLADGDYRRTQLDDLRADMLAAPIDAGFLATLETKLDAEFPDTRMRFRSSTNAEDLEGFSGAGLYESASGQVGEISVVQPPGSNIVADQLSYYYNYNNQPAVYYTRSNQIAAGATVLSRAELYALGQQLDAIRTYFRDFYDPPAGYAMLPMDVEWKRLGSGDGATIEIKQARPYPGRGGL